MFVKGRRITLTEEAKGVIEWFTFRQTAHTNIDYDYESESKDVKMLSTGKVRAIAFHDNELWVDLSGMLITIQMSVVKTFEYGIGLLKIWLADGSKLNFVDEF